MKREFVKTDNAKRFRAGIAMLEARGALEAGWMLVIGRPGEGKTTTLHNWAAEVGAVMLTAQEGWTPTRMLTELAEKLGIEPVRGFERKIEETIAGEEISIVLDEAAFALHNAAACLERLRGITDKSCTLMVMAAMEQDRPKFARRMQIASRISYVCDFHKSTPDDVGAACGQLAEVEIAPDLVERIHRDTDARMRLVMTAINRVEAVARRNGKSRVEAADVRGLALCEDFSRAIMRGGVRRAA
nr:hypothetical protein [Zoogloeaceae bacterium]